MALRKILTQEDNTLRKASREVVNFDKRLHTLLDDMAETLLNADGLGLAAPQVGVLRRAVIVDAGEEGLLELINPRIIHEEGEQEGGEGCLSIPGLYGIVKRPMSVIVKAFDRRGKAFERRGEGVLARAFCHEIDHLNGRLFTELATRYIDAEQLEDEEDV